MPEPPLFVLASALSRTRPQDPNEKSSRTLIAIGLVIAGIGAAVIAAGLAWPSIARLGLGRLPGDIVFRHGNFTLYLPVAALSLISFALSLFLWLLYR